jgi:hypothetical protein
VTVVLVPRPFSDEKYGGVLGVIIRPKDEGIKYEFAGFSLVK